MKKILLLGCLIVLLSILTTLGLIIQNNIGPSTDPVDITISVLGREETYSYLKASTLAELMIKNHQATFGSHTCIDSICDTAEYHWLVYCNQKLLDRSPTTYNLIGGELIKFSYGKMKR